MKVFLKRQLFLGVFLLLCGTIYAQSDVSIVHQKENPDSSSYSCWGLKVDLELIAGHRYFCFKYAGPILLCIEEDTGYSVYVGNAGFIPDFRLTFPKDNPELGGIFDSVTRSKQERKDTYPLYWHLAVFGTDTIAISTMNSTEHSISTDEIMFLNRIYFAYLHYLKLI